MVLTGVNQLDCVIGIIYSVTTIDSFPRTKEIVLV
jgi:hypothetical protein